MLFSLLTGLLALQTSAIAKPKAILRFDSSGRLLNRLPNLTDKSKLMVHIDVRSPEELERRRYHLTYRCGPIDSPTSWLEEDEPLEPKKNNRYRPTLAVDIKKTCLQSGYQIEWELLGADSKSGKLLKRLSPTMKAISGLETLIDDVIETNTKSRRAKNKQKTSTAGKKQKPINVYDELKKKGNAYIGELEARESKILSHELMDILPKWSREFQQTICFRESACGKMARLQDDIEYAQTLIKNNDPQKEEIKKAVAALKQSSSNGKNPKSIQTHWTKLKQYLGTEKNPRRLHLAKVKGVGGITEAYKNFIKVTTNPRPQSFEKITKESIILRNHLRSLLHPYWLKQAAIQDALKSNSSTIDSLSAQRKAKEKELASYVQTLNKWKTDKQKYERELARVKAHNAKLQEGVEPLPNPTAFTDLAPIKTVSQEEINAIGFKIQTLKQKEGIANQGLGLPQFEFLSKGELVIDANERLIQHSPSRGSLLKTPQLISPNESVTITLINAKDEWKIRDIEQETLPAPSLLNPSGVLEDIMLGSASPLLKFGVKMIKIAVQKGVGKSSANAKKAFPTEVWTKPRFDRPPPKLQFRSKAPVYQTIRFPLDQFQAGRKVRYSLYGPDNQKQLGQFDVATMRQFGFRGGMVINSAFSQPESFIRDPVTERLLFQGGYPQLTYSDPNPDIAFLAGAAFYLKPSVIDNEGRFKKKRLPPHLFVGWTLSGTTWEELLDTQTHVGIGVDMLPGIALTAGGVLGPVKRAQQIPNSLSWEIVDRLGVSGWFVGITADMRIAERIKQLQKTPILNIEGANASN